MRTIFVAITAVAMLIHPIASACACMEPPSEAEREARAHCRAEAADVCCGVAADACCDTERPSDDADESCCGGDECAFAETPQPKYLQSVVDSIDAPLLSFAMGDAVARRALHAAVISPVSRSHTYLLTCSIRR